MFALSYLTLLQPTYTGIRWAPLFMELPSKNTGVACHFLLQGIFPTQELNPRLPHWQDSLPLSHPGGPFHNHIFLIKMSKSYESWILSYIKNLFYSVYIFINRTWSGVNKNNKHNSIISSNLQKVLKPHNVPQCLEYQLLNILIYEDTRHGQIGVHNQWILAFCHLSFNLSFKLCQPYKTATKLV